MYVCIYIYVYTQVCVKILGLVNEGTRSPMRMTDRTESVMFDTRRM